MVTRFFLQDRPSRSHPAITSFGAPFRIGTWGQRLETWKLAGTPVEFQLGWLQGGFPVGRLFRIKVPIQGLVVRKQENKTISGSNDERYVLNYPTASQPPLGDATLTDDRRQNPGRFAKARIFLEVALKISVGQPLSVIYAWGYRGSRSPVVTIQLIAFR